MSTHRVRRAVPAAALAVSFLFILAIAAWAQDRPVDPRQNAAGQFDFYVLALSWSPSYCEAAQERAPRQTTDQRCAGRPFSFGVHGLWPQYEQARSVVKTPADFIELEKPMVRTPTSLLLATANG